MAKNSNNVSKEPDEMGTPIQGLEEKCPLCLGYGKISSVEKEAIINSAARFNCTCGRMLTLTPLQCEVICENCGETYRWVVYSDTQLEDLKESSRREKLDRDIMEQTRLEFEKLRAEHTLVLTRLHDILKDFD